MNTVEAYSGRAICSGTSRRGEIGNGRNGLHVSIAHCQLLSGAGW